MSHESMLAAMVRVPAITAILTGGIYEAGLLTPEGISVETTAAAFDADGYLLPIAIVKQRGLTPTRWATDHEKRAYSFAQVVEVWLYQRIDYATLDLAVPIILSTVQGKWLEGDDETFEIDLANIVDRQRDSGVLHDASLIRLDFAITGVLELS